MQNTCRKYRENIGKNTGNFVEEEEERKIGFIRRMIETRSEEMNFVMFAAVACLYAFIYGAFGDWVDLSVSIGNIVGYTWMTKALIEKRKSLQPEKETKRLPETFEQFLRHTEPELYQTLKTKRFRAIDPYAQLVIRPRTFNDEIR